MLAVWSWLKELAHFERDVSATEAAAALTSGGLEVESAEEVGGGFFGVVIAEVVGKRKHPDADKLTLAAVITEKGGTATEVVCGASNVPEPGGRVLWAQPGARLPGMEIGSREIKGRVSPGMLCAEDEIGIGDNHDGIIVLEPSEHSAALGADAAIALGLRDVVFDIGIPANRPDALGHLGIARELVAFVGGRVALPADRLAELSIDSLSAEALVSVAIDDPSLCARYTARVIDGLTVGPSPRWMRQRLQHVGVRPLSNLVDVTNYVMFELGQPLHAFDYAKVRGQRIVVRQARAGETMTTLDEVERRLLESDVLICDGEGPVALAGVMGGADSEVSGSTTRVLLEAAQFAPLPVRRTSRRLDLRSESSHRFERHVDPNGVALASARAAQLLAELGGGRIASGMVDVYPTVAKPKKVSLRASRTTALSGIPIDVSRATDLLSSLGLDALPTDADTIEVTVPTARADLTREVDLIEEVLRLHGFESVPATLPPLSAAPKRVVETRAKRARKSLIGAGLSEAITFGFTHPDSIAAFGFGENDPRSRPISIRNPMSVGQSAMRTTLLPTLLGAVAHNLKHQESDVALFEIGSVFLGEVDGTSLPAEPQHAAALIAGRRPGHLGDREAVGLFDLKGILDRLLRALDPDNELTLEAVASASIAHLHPGLAAEVRSSHGGVVGEFGEIHPTVRAHFDIEVPVFGFEINLGQLPNPGPAQLKPIAKFPASNRDLSFFVGLEIPAETIARKLRSAGGELLESTELLEDYRDPSHVPAGQKGLLWSLTYRSHEKTLTDGEVDKSHEALCDKVLSELSATRR